MTLKIIFDTNFLIDMIRFKVGFEKIEENLNEKVEFFILENTVDELKKISLQKGKTGGYAKLILKILGKRAIKVLKTKEANTDNALIDIAKEGFVIATNDMGIRGRIKKLGLKAIYLRGKKEIMMS